MRGGGFTPAATALRSAAAPARRPRRAAATPSARLEARREEIKKIAAELFLVHGYDGVSVDTVVGRVGGSKTNIYTCFGGKEGLFAAAVENLCRRILQPFRKIEPSGLGVADMLRVFARAYLHIVLAQRTLALYRMIVAESARFPQLGRIWYESGPETARQVLARALAERQNSGELAAMAPERAATLFLDMLTFTIHHRKLMRVSAHISRRDLDLLIEDAVAVFLGGLGKPAG